MTTTTGKNQPTMQIEDVVKRFTEKDVYLAQIIAPSEIEAESLASIQVKTGISLIIGMLKKTSLTVTVAYCFDKSDFTKDQASAWLRDTGRSNYGVVEMKAKKMTRREHMQSIHDATEELGAHESYNDMDDKNGSKTGYPSVSGEDMKTIQKIHDHSVNLGADCTMSNQESPIKSEMVMDGLDELIEHDEKRYEFRKVRMD